MAHQIPVADADYADHLKTYRSFVRGVAYVIAFSAAVLISLAYFLL